MSDLQLTRRFDAAREDVFDAWTDADVLRRWWAAAPGWDTADAASDARPGGLYRLSMRTDTGDIHTVGGEYTEVTRPERLAYTWMWEDMPGAVVSRVLVEFHEDGDGTTVVLTHTGLVDDADRDRHAHGWNGCLDNLDARVLSSVA
jgi:glutathione S-transferase